MGSALLPFFPSHDQRHKQYTEAKNRRRLARQAIAVAGKGKKGRGNKGGGTATTDPGVARDNLAKAEADMAKLAMGLQMREMDHLYSMSAMVALDIACRRDNPEQTPEWWSSDACIVCSNADATRCHALSGIDCDHRQVRCGGGRVPRGLVVLLYSSSGNPKR